MTRSAREPSALVELAQIKSNMKLQWTNLTNAHLIIADQKIKYKKQTMKERYKKAVKDACLELEAMQAPTQTWTAHAEIIITKHITPIFRQICNDSGEGILQFTCNKCGRVNLEPWIERDAPVLAKKKNLPRSMWRCESCNELLDVLNRDLELLKLRNAIADKERWVANANRELAMDGWLLDWNELIHHSDDEISEIIKRIENEKPIS